MRDSSNFFCGNCRWRRSGLPNPKYRQTVKKIKLERESRYVLFNRGSADNEFFFLLLGVCIFEKKYL